MTASPVLQFATPLDRTARICTAALFVAGVVFAAMLVYALRMPNPRISAGVAFLAAAAFVAPGVGAFLLAPRGYRIEGGTLQVERLFASVRIDLAQIVSVSPLAPRELRGAIRLLGSGGAFGYYGHFWSRSLGRFRLYAGNRRELVLLRLKDGRRFVLSPARAEAFIAALRGGAS